MQRGQAKIHPNRFFNIFIDEHGSGKFAAAVNSSVPDGIDFFDIL